MHGQMRYCLSLADHIDINQLFFVCDFSDGRCMLIVNFYLKIYLLTIPDYTSTYDVDISHVLIRNDSHKRLSNKNSIC